jgi:hypothetical protein
MQRFIILSALLAGLLLAACGSPAPAQLPVTESSKPSVIVYKSPT